MSSADGTLVCLHAYDLRALNAEAHVAAGQHDSVLGRREADHALPLRLIRNVSSRVVDPVDVAQVKNRVVVLHTSKIYINGVAYKEFLLEEFELKGAWSFLHKLTISYLD